MSASNPPRAVLFGLSGTALSVEERAFFADTDPLGFIVFARNVQTPDLLYRLVSELRACVGRDDAPVLIDQEGGRVARLAPPYFEAHPPAGRIGAVYRRDAYAGCQAACLTGRLIGAELAALGIDVNCAPVLDMPAPDGHEIIGDRAYGDTPRMVIDLGRAMCAGLMDSGVLPVIKHIPGHGRATADSHAALPRVSAAATDLYALDFQPFHALAAMPLGMTAHVVYEAFDANRPATISPTVVEEVIRGQIGFSGLLMTDDLSMKALSGPFRARAEQALAAGCDVVLHCNGDLNEMRAVAEGCGAMTRAAVARFEAAQALLATHPKPAADIAGWRAERAALLDRS